MLHSVPKNKTKAPSHSAFILPKQITFYTTGGCTVVPFSICEAGSLEPWLQGEEGSLEPLLQGEEEEEALGPHHY